MTVITHNRRRSRLSTLVDQPGGVSVGVALTQARANLAGLEARSREIIAEQVAALAALPAPAAADERALDQAYAHASAVIDAASPFALDDLCAAAANLCDLIDAAPEDRPFDWRVVTVHAQALRLLLTLPPEAADARAQVLDSLKDVLKAKVPGAAESDAQP
ncbi:chemotaxis protein CheE [Brevundimonas naejangsanensis]|uniref:Chemotaxis protein CheE n=1 Tax=Brevundimonas naejangsanensis TaxID=588932 RepID=A0A494RS17_9CAUL|nr:chemotaxis protein CheE [Brevundimonas naejangsanensis]AYG95996.1 chemotaxis protein CheE [Brevundimonas naejangsanensis]